MTTVINTSNEEVRDELEIFEVMCIVEITGYKIDYIQSLPLTQYKELSEYCVMRVMERRAMAKALGVNIKEIV
jgi:hypothetical protein